MQTEQQSGIVYQASVTATENNQTSTRFYIGMTATEFPASFANHHRTFRDKKHKNSTKLASLIRNLKDKKADYTINWKVKDKAPPYSSISKKCHLCILERFYITYMYWPPNADIFNVRIKSVLFWVSATSYQTCILVEGGHLCLAKKKTNISPVYRVNIFWFCWCRMELCPLHLMDWLMFWSFNFQIYLANSVAFFSCGFSKLCDWPIWT